MDDLMAASKPFRVGLYFVSLLACMAVCLACTKRYADGLKKSQKQAAWLYFPIAAAALFVTWKNILLFVYEDYSKYADAHEWLQRSEFFVQAYSSVSDTAQGWWWSSQLLLFTIAFIIFLNIEGRRVHLPLWQLGAYVWLGFGGAISVAMALFCCRLHGLKARTDADEAIRAKATTVETTTRTSSPAAVVSATTKANGSVSRSSSPATQTRSQTMTSTTSMRINELRTARLSPLSLALLTSMCVAAFISILFFTHFTDKAFKYNLVFLHLILAAPSFLPSASPQKAFYSSESAVLRLLYSLLAGGALAHHLWSTQVVMSDGNFSLLNLLHAGFSHYCQAGISWDAVFVSLLSVLYAYIEGGPAPAASVALLIPTSSPGVAFSAYLFWKEMWPTVAAAAHREFSKTK